MFTGIIEEIGLVRNIETGVHSAVLDIQAHTVLEDMHIGDSIAVNGVCLTVTAYDSQGFSADVMHETLARSGLSRLARGSSVNLERAMPANGRFGGHIVAGHVDGTGMILDMQRDDTAIWYTISAAPSLMQFIVEKGSVTVDGISLTVASVSDAAFSVSAIPHTVSATILSERKAGDLVNLETDIIGKYVKKLMEMPEKPADQHMGITKEFLAKYGYYQ